MIDIVCQECGGTYSVKPYRRDKSRFCSFACAGAFRARETLNVGPKPHMVGNTLRKGLRPTNAFKPGVVGKNSPAWKDGDELVCGHCQKTFNQKPWLSRQNGKAKFCSRKCFAASGVFAGSASPCWVGGPKTYRGRDWTTVRLLVIAEQAGCCAECGAYKGKSLPVHHIRPFRMFETATEANARDNLIGLCQSCHMKAENAQSRSPCV